MLTSVRLALSLLSVFAVGAELRAQGGTRGLPGINDYTIGGLGSGTRSCQFLPTFPPFSLQTFQVTTSPNTAVTLLFTALPNCICAQCVFPLPLQACAAAPNPGCPATNQSLDLEVPCGFFNAPLTSNAAGVASITVTMPAAGFTIGTQAAVLNPCATPPFAFLLTQAFQIRT